MSMMFPWERLISQAASAETRSSDAMMVQGLFRYGAARSCWLDRSSPQADLVNAFDQVVEPLITEITCLRSHELRLFHLVSAFIGSPLGGTTA
jgi:hypothetical protein